MRNTINLFIKKKQFHLYFLSFFTFFIVATTPSSAQETIASEKIHQQTFTLKGTVLNAFDNEPLVGASISLQNSIRGVETDIDGNFEIKNVTSGDILSFDFLGFEKQNIVLQQNVSFLKIYLKESSLQLLGAVNTKKTHQTKRSFWQRVKAIF